MLRMSGRLRVMVEVMLAEMLGGKFYPRKSVSGTNGVLTLHISHGTPRIVCKRVLSCSFATDLAVDSRKMAVGPSCAYQRLKLRSASCSAS